MYNPECKNGRDGECCMARGCVGGRFFLPLLLFVVLSCSEPSHPLLTVVQTPTEPKQIVIPAVSPTALLLPLAPDQSITPPPKGSCPRTIFPAEYRSPYPLFSPFAPGLEWRTLIDTIWPIYGANKIYVRAAVTERVSGTVIATRLGSPPHDQLQTTLDPTYIEPPPDDPPGTLRLLGGLAFRHTGCWDLDIRVKELEGHVILLVGSSDPTPDPLLLPK
jgi:hypothetical protein